MAPRRVVVTGLGVVSCLGHDFDTVIEKIRAGTSGVRAMPEWTSHGLRSTIAGAIDDLEPKKQAADVPIRYRAAMSDAALYAVLAALDAKASCGLGPEELGDPRTACIVGSGVGSVDAVWAASNFYYTDRMRRANPYTVLRSMSSSCSAAVSNVLGIHGRSYAISSACATSAHNIGHAYELVRDGVIDRAVAGGAEDVCELITAAFDMMRFALSTKHVATPAAASRPFDRQRDGFVVSGGAGVLVLEAYEAAVARGAPIRAEIIGFGATTDAFDVVLPERDGRFAGECMEAALANAGIPPEQVDYVNAHATSTPAGDVAELRALRRVFGTKLPPFSSTKSMTGHAVGAAGVLELIFCIGMLERAFIAPSINVTDPDPEVDDAPLVTTAVSRELTTILSNNFGFGGTNASLVLRRADA